VEQSLLLLLLPMFSPWCVVMLVCRDLMRRVSSLYPATKVISFIQEGLNSKNNRCGSALGSWQLGGPTETFDASHQNFAAPSNPNKGGV
jgi:hypothetical protein